MAQWSQFFLQDGPQLLLQKLLQYPQAQAIPDSRNVWWDATDQRHRDQLLQSLLEQSFS